MRFFLVGLEARLSCFSEVSLALVCLVGFSSCPVRSVKGQCLWANLASSFNGTIRVLQDDFCRVVIKDFPICNVGRCLQKDCFLCNFRPEDCGAIKDIIGVPTFRHTLRGRNLSSSVPLRLFRTFCRTKRIMVAYKSICHVGMVCVCHIRFRSIIVRFFRDFGGKQFRCLDKVARRTSFNVQGVLQARHADVICSFHGVEVRDEFSVSNGDGRVKGEPVNLRVLRAYFRDRAGLLPYERELLEAGVFIRSAFAVGAVRYTRLTVNEGRVSAREGSRPTAVRQARSKEEVGSHERNLCALLCCVRAGMTWAVWGLWHGEGRVSFFRFPLVHYGPSPVS